MRSASLPGSWSSLSDLSLEHEIAHQVGRGHSPAAERAHDLVAAAKHLPALLCQVVPLFHRFII
jgi:hypothetical protein